jgi:hypothetical protein
LDPFQAALSAHDDGYFAYQRAEIAQQIDNRQQLSMGQRRRRSQRRQTSSAAAAGDSNNTNDVDAVRERFDALLSGQHEELLPRHPQLRRIVSSPTKQSSPEDFFDMSSDLFLEHLGNLSAANLKLIMADISAVCRQSPVFYRLHRLRPLFVAKKRRTPRSSSSSSPAKKKQHSNGYDQGEESAAAAGGGGQYIPGSLTRAINVFDAPHDALQSATQEHAATEDGSSSSTTRRRSSRRNKQQIIPGGVHQAPRAKPAVPTQQQQQQQQQQQHVIPSANVAALTSEEDW